MILCALVLAVATVLALLLVMRRLRERESLLRSRMLDRFLVTLNTGETFDGLLRDVDARTLILVDGSLLKSDGKALPVDGEIVLRRDAVAYMQRPGS